MTWRVVPPAHSALPLRSVVAGAGAVLGGDARPRLAAALAARVPGMRVTLTDSGTSALRLAIEAACRRAGHRRVALPAWACFDVLSAAMGAGVEPLFYDLEPDTLQPTAAALAAVAGAAPAAIVLVHAFGIPADVAAVRRALPAACAIIEDAAQAWGSRFANVGVGATADFALFSFGRGKGLTGGSGGALLHRDPLDAVPSGDRGMRDVVAMAVLTALTAPSLYALPARLPFLRLGETQFKPPRPVGGISNAAAAAVAAGMDAGDAASRARAERATALRAMLPAAGALRNVRVEAAAAPGWLRLPLLTPDASARDVMVAEGRELGVAASYPRSLSDLAASLGVPHRVLAGETGAKTLATCLLTLPTHAKRSRADDLRLERWLARHVSRGTGPRR